MRVIAGTARRLLLKTVDGLDTRPTTDRIKETLFNMLHPYLPGRSFLDLFSGSGAIAIEALSRGAKQATLVEMNKKAISCIKENLLHTHMDDRAKVMTMDVLSAIRMLEGQGESFDFIYMDPPYQKGAEREVLYALAHSPLLTEDTLIIVEAALKTDFSYLSELPYTIDKIKEYKTNKHLFLKRQ